MLDPFKDFQAASGSIVGTEHLRLKKNNQDSFALSNKAFIRWDPAVIGVVCDGCGSQPSSEVGAKLAAPYLIRAIESFGNICGMQDFERVLHLAEEDLLAELRKLAHSTCPIESSWTKNVSEYFLFTVVGFVIMPTKTWIFSLGDSVYSLNNEFYVKEYEGNAPPYLGYRLIQSKFESCKLSIDVCLPTDELQSLLIGSDGVAQLAEIVEQPIPGKEQLIGPLNQFWEEDKYFKNSDMVRRKLFLINRETIRPDWESRTLKRHPGLLEDDTTLIVVRRIPNEERS